MRIGLMRHFRVNKPHPRKFLIPQDELMQWFQEYESAGDIQAIPVDLGETAWGCCYSSDTIRAAKTAEQVFNGAIFKRAELRETPPAALFRQNVRLPLLVWVLLIRAAVKSSRRSLAESKDDIKNRVVTILDEILATQSMDVLVVTHSGLMPFLQQELVRRGFSGPALRSPENGKLYVYEKQQL